ncbi:MAG: AsmA-like C-terminal region-containing protein [Candidatus Accumulibacter sp.]|jgi:hypothetical protein|nr:AsmA-like C-terminal region-containing protein [Accumulibacter sp.]
MTITFFPFNSYIPEIESFLSKLSGVPVKVGQIRVETWPRASLALNDVRIGREKSNTRFDEIQVIPEFASILSHRKILREVVLRGTNLTPERFTLLSSIVAIVNSQNSDVSVKRFRFENADITYAGLSFPEMFGEVNLGANRAFESFSMKTADSNLLIDVKPIILGGHRISFERYGWRPGAGAPTFRMINAKGNLLNDVFTIDSLEILIFDGIFHGKGVMQLSDGKPRFQGSADFERINTTAFGALFGVGQHLSGEAFGQASFSTTAASWSGIFREQLDVNGEFEVRRGYFQGIDLAGAVRQTSDVPFRGGETIFEQLSGKVRTVPGGVSFTELQMSSGLLQSSGALTLNREKVLNGVMYLQMRGSMARTRTPIHINGTLDALTAQIGN